MYALPGRVVEFVTTFLQSHKPSRQDASLRKAMTSMLCLPNERDNISKRRYPTSISGRKKACSSMQPRGGISNCEVQESAHYC